MNIELIPEAGRFYKVNMHCHTNISDGTRSPEEVKAWYKAAGYSAVCFTDHEVLIGHKDLCDDEFIALHGYEAAVKRDLNGHTAIFMPVYHFNMIARSQDNLTMPRFFKNNPSCPGNARWWMDNHAVYSDTIETTKYDPEWINWYLEGVSAGGFLINYNHPEWSLQGPADYLPLDHLHSIEVINGGCQMLGDNLGLHYSTMLRAGKTLVPTAGDDNHRAENGGKAWTMLKAPALTYDALIAAYEQGHGYVSEGPEIHSLVIENDKIIVKTSPAAGIHLYSEGRYAPCRFSRTETFTEAVFDYVPAKFGRFFRIEVRDARGFRAFSNAFYPAKLV